MRRRPRRHGRGSAGRLETGMRTESAVQILSGLKAGDIVITSGLQQLRAGLPVNVVLPVAKKAVATAKSGQ